MIRVIVADDHPVVRTGLREILLRHGAFGMLAEAGTGDEVRQLVAEEAWDVVVLDVNLPDRSGLEVVKDLRRARPNLPVLVFGAYPEEKFAMRALRAGAAGYIDKRATPEEVVKAVLQVAQGRRYLSLVAAEDLLAGLGGRSETSHAPHERLSDREYQVLCLLGSGKSVGQIARELGRSVKTISTYRARILDKMGMHGNAQLVHYALERRLSEPA